VHLLVVNQHLSQLVILLSQLLNLRISRGDPLEFRVRMLRRLVFVLRIDNHLLEGFVGDPEVAREQIFLRADFKRLNEILIPLQLVVPTVSRTVGCAHLLEVVRTAEFGVLVGLLRMVDLALCNVSGNLSSMSADWWVVHIAKVLICI